MMFAERKGLVWIAACLLALSFLTIGAAPAFAEYQTLSWSAYVSAMDQTPTPGNGCYSSSYPQTSWVSTPCTIATPEMLTVGGHGGTDWNSSSGSSKIGLGWGNFTTETGETGERDSVQGANFYSVQLNSNTYSCNYGTWAGECWVQFAFINNPSQSEGYPEIVYALINYYIDNGNCPTNFNYNDGYNCYSIIEGAATTGLVSPSNLVKLSLAGSSNYGSSGQDKATVCIQGDKCYAQSESDVRYTSFALYNNWKYMEYNVFGFGGGSTAGFSAGTNISISEQLKTGSGGSITPSCSSGTTTGEKNNLTLSSTCKVSNGKTTFWEWGGYYHLTMQTSGSGTVTPASGYFKSGSNVQITATPAAGCHSFVKWTGSGSGSYSGTNNPDTITMNGAITETATFDNLCVPGG